MIISVNIYTYEQWTMMEIFIMPHDEKVEMRVNNKKGICAKLSKHIISLKYSFMTIFPLLLLLWASFIFSFQSWQDLPGKML